MTETNATPISILMVEDSPSQAARFKNCLEAEGWQVYWAPTGEAGVHAAQNEAFTFIILDIELPGIDGFEVCRRIKAMPAHTETPTLMLTTRDRAEDALTGLELGALDYIPKDPFAELVLVETLKQMIAPPDDTPAT